MSCKAWIKKNQQHCFHRNWTNKFKQTHKNTHGSYLNVPDGLIELTDIGSTDLSHTSFPRCAVVQKCFCPSVEIGRKVEHTRPFVQCSCKWLSFVLQFTCLKSKTKCFWKAKSNTKCYQEWLLCILRLQFHLKPVTQTLLLEQNKWTYLHILLHWWPVLTFKNPRVVTTSDTANGKQALKSPASEGKTWV